MWSTKEELEQWRRYFDKAGEDIWTIIDCAISLAAYDNPEQLRQRRDGFAVRLFGPYPSATSSPSDEIDVPKSDKSKEDCSDYDTEDLQQLGRTKDDDVRDADVTNAMPDDSHYNFLEEAEALTRQMDEDRNLMKRVLYIKESLKYGTKQPESEALELLHSLEELDISVGVLKDTEIGKEVNAMRKHSSKRVHCQAKKLVRLWKDLVDEWVQSTSDVRAAANEGSPAEEFQEEGLPSPPFDEGALLAARTASLEISQLFDDLEDDFSAGSGPSPPTSNGLSDQWSNGRNSQSPSEEGDPRVTKGATVHITDKHRPLTVKFKQESSTPRTTSTTPVKRQVVTKSVNESMGPVRPANGVVLKQDASGRKPPSNPPRKPKTETKAISSTKLPPMDEEVAVNDRIAVAKRKLQEGYLVAENAKKQRTVQALELTDLPKGGPKSLKANNQGRNWARPR